MKKITIALIILGVAGVISFSILQRNEKDEAPQENDPFLSWDGSWKTYHNDMYRFGLDYPSNLSFKNLDKDTTVFGTLENEDLSPHNGGMAIIVQKTEIPSAQDWFRKNKDRSAPFGVLLLERGMAAYGYSAIIARHAEIDQEDGTIMPGVEQSMVLVKDNMLITINGAGFDFERAMKSFKFDGIPTLKLWE